MVGEVGETRIGYAVNALAMIRAIKVSVPNGRSLLSLCSIAALASDPYYGCTWLLYVSRLPAFGLFDGRKVY